MPLRSGMLAFVATIAVVFGMAQSAQAIDGTEVNGSVGIWAPMLPDFQTPAGNDNQDDVGVIVGLGTQHRFEGVRTSSHFDVFYGDAGDISAFGLDALLRDTWDFGDHHLSAGFGFSMLNFDQDVSIPAIPLGGSIDSDFIGGKIVAGWQSNVGQTPVWIDFSLGLYDMNADYSGEVAAVPVTGTLSDFSTLYGLEFKADSTCMGVPVRPSFKVEYIDNFAQWAGGQLQTDDAVVLTGQLEFLFW